MSIHFKTFFSIEKDHFNGHSDFSLRKRSCQSLTTKDSLDSTFTSKKELKTDSHNKASLKSTISQSKVQKKAQNHNDQVIFGDYSCGNIDL